MTRKLTITKENGKQSDSYTFIPVVILGAGESGIAMGCRLKEQLGFDQFRLFDRQAGIGGTWWINNYPGIACDVPAIFYSFSFCPNPAWTKLHPSGPEIVGYLQNVCEKYQIVDKIQLNTDVKEVKWLQSEKEWEITLHHLVPGTGDLSAKDRSQKIEKEGEKSVIIATETVRAKVIASAVGGLVEPNTWPDDVPGKEIFTGDIMHTARWNPNTQLEGKDVVVIGTGCSAAQVIPQLIKPPHNVKSVTQLLRSPPWVAPPILQPMAEEKWERWSPTLMSKIPGLNYFTRFLFFCMTEADFFSVFPKTEYATKTREKFERQLIRYMKKIVPEEYHEMLTPDYSLGCKRRIIDSDWYASFQKPNVDLTTRPLQRLQARSVVVGPGRTYPDPSKTDSKVPMDEKELPADVIVLANGFETNNWLSPLKVQGKGGKYLHDVWEERGGAQAYLGISMDGFPNFFIVFGPNTATGHSSVILATENTINYSLKFMKPILNGDVDTYEVKEEAEKAYTADIQEKLKGTVWMEGGCRSWYKTANGWNATVYPYSQIDFTRRCMFPVYSHWNAAYTSKGRRNLLLQRSLKCVSVLLALIGLFKMWRQGVTLKNLAPRIRQYIKSALAVLQAGVAGGLESVQHRL